MLWHAAGLFPRPCFIHFVHKATFKLDRTSLNLQSIFLLTIINFLFLAFQTILDTTVQRMQNCISEVKLWMDCNKLKLNYDKTESTLIKSDRIMLPDSAPTSIRVCNSVAPFASHARNLGIRFRPTQPWTIMSQTFAATLNCGA